MKKSPVKSPPKASLVTLGCPMNQVDSERILGGLVSRGFEIVHESDADVIIVNTCGFIESAREESIETILSLAEYKKKGMLKALVVAGCLAERYKEELNRELSEADAVVPLADSHTIPELCSSLIGYKNTVRRDGARVRIGSPHTEYLKIAEGCDNRCSYCAIPSIRGPFRSIPEEEIIGEARILASLGTKELIIIAQDTTRYGLDLDGRSLPGLLERLEALDGIRWLRLMYAHPAHMSGETIRMFSRLPKLLRYVDLPIQHISDSILERMGRKVSSDEVRKLVDTLRNEIEGLVLRTALIVGFPGETDQDFRELLTFVERCRFERLGAFLYSPEEGTRAALLEDRVPEKVAHERYDALLEVQAGISESFHKSLIGGEYEMIVDWINPDTGEAIGRSYMDAPEVDGNISVARGVEKGDSFVRVRIVDSETYDLCAEVV